MSKNTIQPAFPCEWDKMNYTPSMTLRDHFAAKAMQVYMVNEIWRDEVYKLAAEESYKVADAMLEAREA